jgi:hypothetical protein
MVSWSCCSVAARNWDLQLMLKSLTYMEHMTRQCTLLVIPMMAMKNRITPRTDPWGMQFSCEHGGDRTVWSCNWNCLWDINLCKKIVAGPLAASDQGFWESHFTKLCQRPSQCRKKPPLDSAQLRRLALLVTQGLRVVPLRNRCVRSCTGSSIGGLDFLVSKLALRWPYSRATCRHS